MPEPPPPFDDKAFGESGGFEGYYTRTENGRTYLTTISEVSGGRPGEPEEEERRAFFIEKDPSDHENPYYRWWEATTMVFDAAEFADKSNPRPKPIETFDLDEEVVRAYRARLNWFTRYTHTFDYPEGHPLGLLKEPSDWSKTQYGRVEGRYFYLTYSVKYFYRNRANNFANTVARAVKAAKRAGIAVRVI